MAGHVVVHALPLAITLFIFLTSILVSPEAPLGLWQDVTSKYRSYKAERHEKRCREAREKLKKYWVIEMKKLHR